MVFTIGDESDATESTTGSVKRSKGYILDSTRSGIYHLVTSSISPKTECLLATSCGSDASGEGRL